MSELQKWFPPEDRRCSYPNASGSTCRNYAYGLFDAVDVLPRPIALCGIHKNRLLSLGTKLTLLKILRTKGAES